MITKILTPSNIKVNLLSSEKDEVFEEMIEVLVLSKTQPTIDRKEVLKSLMLREEKQSTGIIHGIAVPHAQCLSIQDVSIVVGISQSGIEYDALDGGLVNLIIMMLFAHGDTESHLQSMKDIVNILNVPDFLKIILSKKSSQEVFDVLCSFEAALKD